jgi:hypothetical protein
MTIIFCTVIGIASIVLGTLLSIGVATILEQL